jgi:hypothetical protein
LQCGLSRAAIEARQEIAVSDVSCEAIHGLRNSFSVLGAILRNIAIYHDIIVTSIDKSLALSRRLPSDQDFAAGRNIARDEALRTRGEELIKTRLQDNAQALLEV